MSSFITFGLAFKNKIIELKEGATQLTLKKLALVRLVKKKFFQDLEGLYETGRNVEALSETLRIARAKGRLFEVDFPTNKRLVFELLLG